MNKKPLGLIIHERFLLEDETEERGGELTEELDKLWNDNEMELAEKVDAYAFTLDQLKAVQDNLRERKRKADQIIKSSENAISRIKKRLRHYADALEQPLRGHEYAFHPYNSEKRTVNQEQVDAKYRRVVLDMSMKEYQQLAKHLSNNVEVKQRDVKVSELPGDHPAIEVKGEETVRRR